MTYEGTYIHWTVTGAIAQRRMGTGYEDSLLITIIHLIIVMSRGS